VKALVTTGGAHVLLALISPALLVGMKVRQHAVFRCLLANARLEDAYGNISTLRE